MIKFDINRLSHEKCLVKSITQAMGGSVSILDEVELAHSGKEKCRRHPLPLAVARAFQQLNNVSKFYKPTEMTITKYDDLIVAIEMHPFGSDGERHEEGVFGIHEWVSYSEKNAEILERATKQGDWYIDGTFVYQLPTDLNTATKHAAPLTKDGKFRSLTTTAWKLQNLSFNKHMVNTKKLRTTAEFISEERDVMLFVASNNQFVITPPIWKNLDSVGNAQIGKHEVQVSNYRLDTLSQHFSVNLNFALNAGKSMGECFGYDVIEALQIPKLMVNLNTVNLPNIPKAVKSTYDIGLSFKHGLAWLMGLLTKVKTLQELVALRSSLKYITTKALFKAEMFQPKHLYKGDHTENNIELLTPEQALETAESKYTTEYVSQLIASKRTVRISDDGLQAD